MEISRIVDQIMKKRGLAAEPRLSLLKAPDSWPGVSSAADLLTECLVGGKSICLWGDYDADGITSAVLGIRVLNQINDLNSFGCKFSYYLPHRIRDGYGVNPKGVEKARAAGSEVLLTADCGISSHEGIEKAINLGMTVIISDHHIPDDGPVPNAHAICDPMLDPDYIEREGMNLAGVGQLFILLAAVCQRLAFRGYKIPRIEGQLDLVALGSIADVSSMSGQNRILCYYGMDLLSRKRRPGIQALKEVSGLPATGFLCSKDIGFAIAPRLNAAGRMKDPHLAFDCLMEDDLNHSFELAKELDELNSQRKSLESRMTEEACEQARFHSAKYPGGLVLYNPCWSLGIAGIVASRVCENFDVPVIVCGGKKSCRGSARSVYGIDIYSALNQCASLLTSFGGHSGAAGVDFPLDNLDAFRQMFSDLCGAQVRTEQSKSAFVLENRSMLSAYDAMFPCASLGFAEMEQIARLEPCGVDNPVPVFLSEEMTLIDFTQKGILSTLFFRTDTGQTIKSKVFRLPYTPDECEKDLGKRIVALYTPEISSFRGEVSVNICVKEMARA